MNSHDLIEAKLLQAENWCHKIQERMTPIRRHVLELIYRQNSHVTAYELLRLFREVQPRVEAMTVYRALNFLEKNGFVHRIASQNAYTACMTPEQSHHPQILLCENCRRVEELNFPILEVALEWVATDRQFKLLNKPLEMIGICKTCQS